MYYNKVEICGINTAELKVLKEDEKRHLLECAKAGDMKARESLIDGNLRLVLSIIQRFSSRSDNMDDLFQVGCIGLIKAIDNFNTELEVKFSTYAVPMIAGEIKRFMRDDGSVKVSRAMKQTAKEMNVFVEEYTHKNGQAPSVKEIAKAFSMDEAEAVFVMGSSKMPVSLQSGTQFKDGKQRELIEVLSAEDDQDDLLDKMLLRGAIENLSERDRKIIVLRYFRDMTQSEVAEKIGVSQVQVSRIENRIIKEFREKLTG